MRRSSAAVLDALRARRTIASTGPNVAVAFELDGVGIGAAVARRDAMRVHVAVRATDTVVRLELIEGDAAGWRVRPLPVVPAASTFAPGRHLVRVETGWGRHGTVADWNVVARVRGGRLVAATPYFRYPGYATHELEPTERVHERSEAHVAWTCRSRSVPSGAVGGTHHQAGGPQTLLLEVDGDADTRLVVASEVGTVTASLPQLVAGSVGRYGSEVTGPAMVVQRAAPEREWALAHDLTIAPPAAGGFVYLRLLQADGQAAWVSPVFLD